MKPGMKCRFCGEDLRHTFCDLGMSPLSNAYLSAEQTQCMEPFYPLHVHVCDKCYLVQLQEFETPEHIFGDYAYFSSYSDSWLAHAKEYAAEMVSRFHLTASSHVVEIGSNDGYLLQYFKERGIPIFGIEPAANVAEVARKRGVPSHVAFFGVKTAHALAAEGRHADLLVGNNVLAHVPDLNDFVAGMKILLKPGGVITMEFPHLLRFMQENQFDTIYHEHFSYFSFMTVQKVFAGHGLMVFDVDELPTHGGSLRVYARHAGEDPGEVTEQVRNTIDMEVAAGFDRLETYTGFDEVVKGVKRKVLDFLVRLKEEKRSIAAYGAPAKGNTLLNYCGIRTDFIDYTVDRSPHKQGRFLPGVHIPICDPARIAETRPDFVLILPWNLQDEIMEQMAHIRSWGGRFIRLIPEPRVLP